MIFVRLKKEGALDQLGLRKYSPSIALAHYVHLVHEILCGSFCKQLTRTDRQQSRPNTSSVPADKKKEEEKNSIWRSGIDVGSSPEEAVAPPECPIGSMFVMFYDCFILSSWPAHLLELVVSMGDELCCYGFYPNGRLTMEGDASPVLIILLHLAPIGVVCTSLHEIRCCSGALTPTCSSRRWRQ